jgi:hypothetical protein
MGNRFSEDIRRIAGIEDDQGNPLGEAKEREKIPGGRGVGYYSGSGGQVSSDSGFPSGSGTGSGVGSPGVSANNPQGDDSTNTTGSGGSGSGGTSSGHEQPFDPFNPLAGITTEENGRNDISDYMNNVPYNSLDALKIIEGVDPSTGRDLTIFTDGYFPPPEGWDDAETPPNSGIDTTFQPGFYWKSVWAFATDTQSPQLSANEIASGLGGELISLTPFDGPPATSYTAVIKKPNGTEQGFGINRFTCTGGDPSGPGDYCSLIPPTTTDEFWPVLDEIIMTFNNGVAAVSDFINPADSNGFTQNNNSAINIESKTNPGEYYTVQPNGTGGTLVYETATPGGEPIGVFKTFNASGQFDGYGDAAAIDYVKP